MTRHPRRGRLWHRVRSAGANQQAVMGAAHPAAPPGTPMVMPLATVTITPDLAWPGSQYATIAYRELTPIWAPDGETIPAEAPGRWGQLAAAGRP